MLRRIGIGVFGLVLLIAAGSGGIYGVIARRFAQQYDIATESVAVEGALAVSGFGSGKGQRTALVLWRV